MSVDERVEVRSWSNPKIILGWVACEVPSDRVQHMDFVVHENIGNIEKIRLVVNKVMLADKTFLRCFKVDVQDIDVLKRMKEFTPNDGGQLVS